jgi:CBS domain-containing protein
MQCGCGVVGLFFTALYSTTRSDTPVRDAARVMAQHWIRHLPVVDDGRLVGMISQRDITGVFAALRRDSGAATIDTDSLVRELRLARLEPGDLD